MLHGMVMKSLLSFCGAQGVLGKVKDKRYGYAEAPPEIWGLGVNAV
jgi:hypothetical protein